MSETVMEFLVHGLKRFAALFCRRRRPASSAQGHPSPTRAESS